MVCVLVGNADPGWITITYIDPVLERSYTKTSDGVSASRRWSGDVEINVRFDGTEYLGTGTARGSAWFSPYDVGYYSVGFYEEVAGVMEDGSVFSLIADLRRWGWGSDFLLSEILMSEGSLSFGYDVHSSSTGFLIYGQTELYGELNYVTQVSAVPVPAAGLLLLSAVAGVAGVKARRRR